MTHNCTEKDLMSLNRFDEEYIACMVCGKDFSNDEVEELLINEVLPDINNTYFN
jgi:hypothetical protein